MADRFFVSLPSGEGKLSEWIRKMMRDNEVSPSLIFRDAMLEKKKEWDVMNSENPIESKKTIKRLKETLSKFNKFIELNKTIQEDWFKFNGIDEKKK